MQSSQVWRQSSSGNWVLWNLHSFELFGLLTWSRNLLEIWLRLAQRVQLLGAISSNVLFSCNYHKHPKRPDPRPLFYDGYCWCCCRFRRGMCCVVIASFNLPTNPYILNGTYVHMYIVYNTYDIRDYPPHESYLPHQFSCLFLPNLYFSSFFVFTDSLCFLRFVGIETHKNAGNPICLALNYLRSIMLIWG